MKKSTVYLLLVFIHLQNACAQQLQLTNYSPQQGASVYGANSIFQDSGGWMWFTSGYEIMRYDGHRFKTYYPAANTKMDFCFQGFEVNGEIWIQAAPYMLKVAGDSLLPLDIGSNAPDIIHHLQHVSYSWFLCRNGLYRLKGRHLDPFITDTALSIVNSESLAAFNDSLLISHKYGKSLIAYDLKHQRYHTLPMAVTDIRQDEKGTIFLLVKGTGIVKLKNIFLTGEALNIETEPAFLFDHPIYEQFVVDGQGSFWTYTGFKELVKLTPGMEAKSYKESHGLPSLWFNQLFVDREKNLWIGFNSGLCKIRNTNWERYTTDELLYSDHILFFAKGPVDGQVFVGTKNGVNIFDNGQFSKLEYRQQAFHCDYLLTLGSGQYCVRDSTLFSIQIDPGTLKINSVNKLADLPARPQQLLSDQAGGIYIPTTHGIFRFANQKLTRITNDTSHFRSLLIDSRNRLWAGKFAGELQCYRISNNGSSPILEKLFDLDSISPSLPRIRGIRALHEDRMGNIFTGTRYNGLFILTVQNDKVRSVKHFGEKNGLTSNSVWSIAMDASGACWVANAKGVNHIEKINNQWQIKDEGMKRQLYQATLAFAGEDNSIWIANHPGIVVIRNNVSISQKPFSVFITGIRVNGKIIHPGSINRFSYRHNNVSINFSANTYRHEESVLYSWRLAANDEWTIPAPTHEVNYSALRPVKYYFNVRAMNAEGQWSTNEETFGFEILPPFWQQAWFILLVLLAIAAGLYILYRYRLQRLKELYEMRNIIARDLHDEIGSTLTSINILSKVSHRHLKKDDDKAGELLEKVIDQSQQIQQNMSDIVWAIRPDNDRMENMTVRMREYLSHTLEPKNIAIDFKADEKIMQESLTMQQRRDFFLIFKEAVNNIAKYSQCRQTQVKLTRQSGNMSLLIKDDGIGFDSTVHNSTGGLVNMQRRAELLKGVLTIQSAPGKGTKVELLVPATS